MAEYKSTNEEGKCIFCEIAEGNIKPMGEGIIYEDKDYLAWLSPFPNTEGFTVVIPKKHFDSDVLAMPNEKLCEFVVVSKKISKILIEYFKDVGRVGLIMEGTGINHAHIKLFPMHGTEHIKKGGWKQHHSKNNKYFEIYEGYLSSNDGPKANEQKLKALAKELREVKLD
jgi:diadenosine tetraphosphate (Ap4A) HIT family hydrolase